MSYEILAILANIGQIGPGWSKPVQYAQIGQISPFWTIYGPFMDHVMRSNVAARNLNPFWGSKWTPKRGAQNDLFWTLFWTLFWRVLEGPRTVYRGIDPSKGNSKG